MSALLFDLLCCGKATEVVEFMIAPDLRLEGAVSSVELELRTWESGGGGGVLNVNCVCVQGSPCLVELELRETALKPVWGRVG